MGTEERIDRDSSTSTSFLEALADVSNEAAWRRFVEFYRPLFHTYACRRGLQPTEADDVAQEVIYAVLKAYPVGQYDRRRGRFRDWLRGIASRQTSEFLRKRARSEGAVGQSSSVAPPGAALEAPDELSELWEQEWRRFVVERCLSLARAHFEPRRIEAFERVAIRGETVKDVATALGMTANAVHQAKYQVLKKMRQLHSMLEFEERRDPDAESR